jgi:hypothetical protein
MKKASKILLTILLVSVLALTVVACNNKQDPVDTRPDTVSSLENALLASQNSLWTKDLTDDQIASLDLPGDYVVAREWISLAGDVVFNSGLQEGKIKHITDYVLSDKGKAFLRGEKVEDTSHFIATFVEIGLTSTDVEGLVYDGVYAFIKQGKSVVESIITSAQNIIGNSALSAVARQNIEETISAMQSAKASFEYASKDVENTLTQLEQCKSSIQSLVSFGYDTAMIFGDGGNNDLIDSITSGTLHKATASEIATYLGSVVASVKSVGNTISQDAIMVQDALSAVLDFYTKVSVSVPVIDTMMMVLDNNKILPTVLPLVVDFVENIEVIALGDTNHKFVENVMGCFGEGYHEGGDGLNALIAYARIALASLGIDYTASADAILEAQKGAKEMIFDVLIDKIASYGNEGRGRMPIIYLAFMLNAESESGLIYDVPVKRFGDLVFADNYFKQFKRHFREYRSGVASKPDALISSANVLLSYCGIDETVGVNTNFSEQWYDTLCSKVLDKINAEMGDLYMPAYYEMVDLAEVLSSTVIDKLLDVASLAPQKVGTAEYDTLTENVENLYAQIVESILG